MRPHLTTCLVTCIAAITRHKMFPSHSDETDRITTFTPKGEVPTDASLARAAPVLSLTLLPYNAVFLLK